jgi:hypothetical protein
MTRAKTARSNQLECYASMLACSLEEPSHL